MGPLTSYHNILICNTTNVSTAELPSESLIISSMIGVILIVILCISRFIFLHMNLIDLSAIKKKQKTKKDYSLISYPDSCDCGRTGRSPVYWCNWNVCHRQASVMCIRQRLQVRNRQILKKNNNNKVDMKKKKRGEKKKEERKNGYNNEHMDKAKKKKKRKLRRWQRR